MWVQSLSWEGPLEKEMATHFSILAWKILWTEEPVGYRHGVTKSQTWLKPLSMHAHEKSKPRERVRVRKRTVNTHKHTHTHTHRTQSRDVRPGSWGGGGSENSRLPNSFQPFLGPHGVQLQLPNSLQWIPLFVLFLFFLIKKKIFFVYFTSSPISIIYKVWILGQALVSCC